MTQQQVRLEAKGFEELQRRFQGAPGIQRAAMRAVFQQARAAGVAKAKKPLRGRGEEKAVETIFGSYNERGAAIWSIMRREKAISIEEGRPPGKPPSTSALARNLYRLGRVAGGGPSVASQFRRRHRIKAPEIMDTLTREQRAAVWEYFENARRTGTRAFRYMAGVTEKMEQDLPKWLQRAGDRIVRRLAGKMAA